MPSYASSAREAPGKPPVRRHRYRSSHPASRRSRDPPKVSRAGRIRAGREVHVNRVLLTGRLTRDPEMRSLPSGKVVTQFSVATNDYRGGEEKPEYHDIVTWV